MGRSAQAGTDKEFSGGLPVRWDAGGGDSNKRFRSAIAGLPLWRKILQRANFTTLDIMEFLEKCKDEPGHAIYIDPPFPDDGDVYRHKFNYAKHEALALRLREFAQARIVMRFYDHPLVRAYYAEVYGWRWSQHVGRKQSNAAGPELLLVRPGARKLLDFAA